MAFSFKREKFLKGLRSQGKAFIRIPNPMYAAAWLVFGLGFIGLFTILPLVWAAAEKLLPDPWGENVGGWFTILYTLAYFFVALPWSIYSIRKAPRICVDRIGGRIRTF